MEMELTQTDKIAYLIDVLCIVGVLIMLPFIIKNERKNGN